MDSNSTNKKKNRRPAQSKKRRRRKLRNPIFKHLQMFFPLIYIYYEVVLRAFTKISIFSKFGYIIMFSLCFGCILNALILLLKRKHQWIASISLLTISSIVYTAEVLTKRTFQVFMSPTALLGNAGNVAGDFSSELITSITGGIVVIIFMFIPVIIYALMKDYIYESKRRLVMFANILLAILMGVSGSLIANFGASKKIYTTQFDFNRSMETFGLVTTFRLDLSGASKNVSFTIDDTPVDQPDVEPDPEQIDYGYNVMELGLDEKIATGTSELYKQMNTYVNSLQPSNKNKYTGLFEGKNLILICAEAFSDAVIDPELTPTLYRMVHNGFYFSDYYQPTWGGSTSTGEFSFLFGIAPCYGPDTMLGTQGHNLYFSLGNALQRKNYYSGAYHNGTFDFYSRQLTHMNIGYDYWCATGSGIEDVCGRSYPSDELMLTATLDSYVNYQPFSMYYMTVNGHAPYNRDGDWRVAEHYQQVINRYGNKYPDRVNYFICYQLELEEALTSLLAKLEAYGIADNTVIALTSDHYPYGLDESATFGNDRNYLIDLYGYDYQTNWEQDRNTCIIWSGCLEHDLKDYAVEISTPTYSLDITPTLLNLFGIEYDSRLLVGRDVFSNAEPLVLWNSYSWVTDKGTYQNYGSIFTPKEGVEIPDGYVERINNIVSNKISYSKQWLDHDYYGYLFGEDPITVGNDRYFAIYPNGQPITPPAPEVPADTPEAPADQTPAAE